MKILHVLAFDPGPSWMGWAHLRVEHTPGCRATYVEGGEAACDVNSTQALIRKVREARERSRQDDRSPEMLIAIESPAGYIFNAARSPQVLLTARRAGGIAWLAEADLNDIVEATAQQVRQILCGKANAEDQQVHMTVRANVFHAPESKNSHVADAAAMGLVGAWLHIGHAVIPTPKPKAKKTPKPKAKKPRKAKTAA